MLTEQDVKSLMQHSPLKSCALDPMPSTLVSRCDVLLPVLTRLINMSLKSGQFPVAWKEALVLRLLKKPGARFSKVPVTLRARNQIFKSKYN